MEEEEKREAEAEKKRVAKEQAGGLLASSDPDAKVAPALMTDDCSWR